MHRDERRACKATLHGEQMCVCAAAEQQVKLQQDFAKWWSEHPSASVEEVRVSPHLPCIVLWFAWERPCIHSLTMLQVERVRKRITKK